MCSCFGFLFKIILAVKGSCGLFRQAAGSQRDLCCLTSSAASLVLRGVSFCGASFLTLQATTNSKGLKSWYLKHDHSERESWVRFRSLCGHTNWKSVTLPQTVVWSKSSEEQDLMLCSYDKRFWLSLCLLYQEFFALKAHMVSLLWCSLFLWRCSHSSHSFLVSWMVWDVDN